MKKLLFFSLFIISFSGFSQSAFQQHGAIPYGDMVAEVKSYRYNTGSSPTEIGMLKMLFGTVTTNGSGVATVEMTMDGLSTGAALFTNVISKNATAELNTSGVSTVPIGSIKTTVSGKTLTINVVESTGILLGGEGLAFSGSGIVVNFVIIGY